MTTASNIKKRPLTVALMTVSFLAAMEITITVLATPTITRDLAGFDLMSFVFSSFLLTSAITTPIFGRLADQHGRKRTLLVGIVIFLIGCILCGLSQTMIMLIVFRAIQGIGAGSIFTLTYTIAGDAFPIESRATILGALSSVWGVAGLAGPLLGGFFIETLSWHWVFFINVPIGIISIIVLNVSFKENFTPKKTQEKTRERWAGLITKVSVFINIITFFTCVVLQGLDVYLALYLQNVLGHSALIAGLAILPMSLSWFSTSYIVGKLAVRIDSKILTLIAGIWQLVCCGFFVSMDITTSLPLAVVFIFLVGFGTGGLMTATTLAIQESVSYEKRGTAMGINSFVKTMGQAVGIALLGAALNMQLSSFFAGEGLVGIDPSNLFSSGEGSVALDGLTLSRAIDSGIDVVFWIMLILTGLMILITFFMPRLHLGKMKSAEPSEHLAEQPAKQE